MAREVVNHLAVLGEDKRQSIVVQADGTVEVQVDHMVLRQAVINLLDNAIKYSPEGATIRVAVRRQPDKAVLEVVDPGPGIETEHTGRVFDRFYRVDKARSRDLGGAGLGLSIARWAVEAHGGRIELESTEGVGSTFRVVLPVSTAARKAGSGF
jgi:signal transduction histidine kinase